ncbi:MAG TPA: AAA family ATPase [Streptosporangiaceae bacterium]|nr:AAA family ATPase [Streptosporangiaceae bacterium]
MATTRCPALIGRRGELEVLTGMLGQEPGMAGRSPGVAFLTGEAGAGKSRLALELARIASERGFTVLTGRAAQSANPVPLRPIVEALIGIARTMPMPDDPALAQYRPALAAIVPGWSADAEREPEISPLILGEAMIRLLAALPGRGALLVLEDLQYADPETLTIVEYLSDSLREGTAGGTVRCVATVQDAEPSVTADLIRSVHARRAVNVVNVGRLREQEVRAMAAACLEQPTVPEPVLGRLLADCDGLPFAVEELLAAAVSSGELVKGESGWSANEAVVTGVPVSIAESVRYRLADLGPKVADVVVTAAVLGRQFDWTLLPGLTGIAAPELLAALRRACEVQLIEPHPVSSAIFRFRHSLTRNAIVSNLLPPDLARRSAAAAGALMTAYPGLPVPWCELAAELHETAGQPAQAATLLLMAGRRALAAGAITSAGTSLRRASNLVAKITPAEPQLQVDIDEALTSVHVLAGDCDQLVHVSRRLFTELDAVGAPPAVKALTRLRVARSLSECDRTASAEEYVAAARKLAGGASDPALGGWTDAVAAHCSIDAGDLDRALELAMQGLAAAEAAGLDSDRGGTGSVADAACEALEVIGRRERTRDTAAANAAFGRAYRIAADHDLPVRQIRALHELGTIEMLEHGGSGRLCEARSLAVQSGAISVATVLDLQLANAWSLGSDLDLALEAATRSEESARRLHMHRVEAMAIGAAGSVRATSPDHSEVEKLAKRAESTAPGDTAVLTTTQGEVRVTAAIIENDLGRARAASEAGIGHARAEPLSAPSLAWGYWPLLRAAAGEGGREAIAESRAAGAEVAFWNRGCLAYAEAVFAGREGKTELASKLARHAEAYFSRCAPLWNHLMHRLVAEDAFAAGWGDPAQWLRDAIGDLEAGGYDRLASACRGIMRLAGERVPRSGRGNAEVPGQLRHLGITSREMDVFLLVGRGLSNSEIATRLFISPKTVETHIGSLVSKTGRDGRRELIAHAARLLPAETSARC